jgi:selenocysteine lyase/cysteine desulfurase
MDWSTLRSAEFPVTERWAFLDHAGVSPLPARTARVLADFGDDLARHGSAGLKPWVARAEQTRQQLARLMNCDPLDLAFTKNTGEGLVIVAEGYPWRPGDNVVVAAEEYPSNQYPWLNLADRGVEARRVASRGNRILLDDLAAACDGRTRLIALSFVEFASGYRNDLAAVGELCRSRGLHLCVDAIQGLGVLPLDVRHLPIDFLAVGSHKWLLGPQGAGAVYVRRELIDVLHPVGVGAHSVRDPYNYDHIDLDLKPHAGRYEGGTLNFAGIAGWGASLSLFEEVGYPRITERIHGLTERLCEQARASGIDVFSSRVAAEWSGIVSLIVPGADPKALVRRGREAGFIVNSRGGRLRVSPHCYNTEDELGRLVEVLCR